MLNLSGAEHHVGFKPIRDFFQGQEHHEIDTDV